MCFCVCVYSRTPTHVTFDPALISHCQEGTPGGANGLCVYMFVCLRFDQSMIFICVISEDFPCPLYPHGNMEVYSGF